jgi:hypothetical protein
MSSTASTNPTASSDPTGDLVTLLITGGIVTFLDFVFMLGTKPSGLNARGMALYKVVFTTIAGLMGGIYLGVIIGAVGTESNSGTAALLTIGIETLASCILALAIFQPTRFKS